VDRNHAREKLTGPVPSIRTPFLRNGDVDYDGLRNLIDFVIGAGAKTVMLTAGDSHYDCLSDEEIAEITKVTCEQTSGRAMVIAADRRHSTARAIQFAEFAKEAGADIVMCTPPDWDASCTEETLAEHYAAVAGHLPVMIVTNVFASRNEEFGLRAVDLALERSEKIVAIKDDVCGAFGRRLGLLAHERCPIISGGLKQNHLDAWPYGCDGYLSTFITFKPEVSHAYWSAIESRDMAGIRRIIGKTDMPFFAFCYAQTGGKDAAVHGVMEAFGITQRWRRPPYYSLSDAEMEKVRGFLRSLDLL